jgi:hypothetical protein
MRSVAFFGSSIVEGAGASSPVRRFTTIVSRTLGWNEINLGRRRSTVTGRDDEGQLIDEDSGLARVPDVVEAAADLVIVAFDSGDYKESRALGTMAEFRQGTFCSDFDTILRGLLFSIPKEQVVLSTTLRPQGQETPNALGLTPSQYDGAIRSLADRHELRMLDPVEQAGLARSEWDEADGDGPYPNDAGHECLAAYFIQEMHDNR